MQTSTDKWYTTKILSSLLIVILLMIFILNQSFKSEYALPEIPPLNPIEIIEFENNIEIIEEKIQPKPKVVKSKATKVSNTNIKIVDKKIDLQPAAIVETIVVDSSLLTEVVEHTFAGHVDQPAVVTKPKSNEKVKAVIPSSEPLHWSEIMPEYPGGAKALWKFLSRNISYPAYEQEIGLEGSVLTSFVVSQDGSIENIEILKSPSAGFTRAAKSVISKMSKWKPGYHNGNAVAVKYTLPLRFKLN